jgi:histidyl-tRNA synthetase
LEAKYGDKIKETETEVFVASIGETDPCRKLAVLAELWKHGIKAETLYV